MTWKPTVVLVTTALLLIGAGRIAVVFRGAGTLPIVPDPAIRAPAPRVCQSAVRLEYDLCVDYEKRTLIIVNRNAVPWTRIHAEVGYGEQTYNCPAVNKLGLGGTLRLHVADCRSEGGASAPAASVVRVEACEGTIVCGIEPGVPAQR